MTRKATFHLQPGDVVIDDGTCLLILDVDPGTIFDADGLLAGGAEYWEIEYLEARQRFDDGHQVLDLAADFPGLWERG